MTVAVLMIFGMMANFTNVRFRRRHAGRCRVVATLVLADDVVYDAAGIGVKKERKFVVVEQMNGV